MIGALLSRDIRLATRAGCSAALALAFFAAVATLVPLGVGVDLRLLLRVAAGVFFGVPVDCAAQAKKGSGRSINGWHRVPYELHLPGHQWRWGDWHYHPFRGTGRGRDDLDARDPHRSHPSDDDRAGPEGQGQLRRSVRGRGPAGAEALLPGIQGRPLQEVGAVRGLQAEPESE